MEERTPACLSPLLTVSDFTVNNANTEVIIDAR